MNNDMEKVLEQSRKSAVVRLIGQLGIVAFVMSAIGATVLLFFRCKKEKAAGRPETADAAGEEVAPEANTEAHVKQLQEQRQQDSGKAR